MQRWTTLFDIFDPVIRGIPALKHSGVQLKEGIHQAVVQGGDGVRSITDLLHGVPLGHPLHPLLTDLPIGAWTLAALFDILSLMQPSRRNQQAADALTDLGILTAIPTAVAGMTDYSTIKNDAADYGLLHGMLNTTGLALYIMSHYARKRNRVVGIGFGLLGLSILTASAWLCGEMVYHLRVGVNHSPKPDSSKDWQAALLSVNLAERQPQRIEVNEKPVLLYRENDTVYAIGATCSHAGGPLEEGKFYDGCVQCPWHDSVFDLRSGKVVHGPSTFGQPTYDVREHEGWIEVRSQS